MNISLSWANYALITVVCLILYYVIVALVYYRKELTRPFPAEENNRLTIATASGTPIVEDEGFTSVDIPEGQISEEALSADDKLEHSPSNVQDFVDEIYAYTEACGKDIGKEELRESIRRIIHKYPALIDSSLEDILKGVINTASENNCSIHWSEDELSELWNG